MSLKKDIIGAEVQIGSNEAQKSLVDLSQKTSELANENDRLRITQAKLKALNKENTEEYKKITKTISDNSKQIKDNNAQMDALRKTIGVTEMSTKQLSKRALELRRELSGMTQASDPERFNKLNKELIDTERQMRKNKAAIGETKGAMGALGALMPALGFAAIAAGVKSLVTNIINVRKEYEKYEAVLANALGSHRQARQEMQMLQQFAAETPFSLQELTGAYVKLVNYGLKPSKEELRKLGDLASSTGKGFDQLVEAVADAATGEFERLKEFGVKAKKEGDNIAFTFKGQTTVIDNNADSIKKYLTGLGDLQGVSGSMAAIAGTLGGKISNMGDAWDNLMNTMGAGSSGIMVTVITWLTNMVNMFDGAFKSIKQIKEAVRDKSITDAMNSAIVEIDGMSSKLEKTGISQQAAHKRALDLYSSSMTQSIQNLTDNYNNATGAQKENLKKRLDLMTGEYDAVKEHYAAMDKITSKPLSDDARKKASDKAIEILDAAQNERMAKISAQYASESQSDAWFHDQQLAAETAYLIQKRAIMLQFGQSTVDVDNQINQKRIEAQKDFNASMSQLYKELEDAQTQAQKSDDSELDALIQKGNAVISASKEIQDKEKQILQQRQDAYLNFAEMIGQSFGDLIADSEASFGDYLKNVLAMSLEALHQFLLVGMAKTWIQAATEGAPINPWAVAKAMAKIVFMEAAYQGVKGLLTRGKQSGGFSSTDGPDSQPDGVYHKNEFIASAPAVRNPTVRPILNIIDMAQRQGKIATLNLPAVMASIGAFPAGSKQSGGFGNSSGSTPFIVSGSPQFSDEYLTRLENFATRLENMEWNFNFTEFEKIQKRRAIREKQSKL